MTARFLAEIQVICKTNETHEEETISDKDIRKHE